MDNTKKCTQILDNSEKCGAYALKGNVFCFSHDPGSREAKALAVKRGGEAKQIRIFDPLEEITVDTPNDLVRLLAATINEVRDGSIDPKIASTIGFLSGHLIRAFEVAELNSKVEQVKSVLDHRTKKRRG